MLTWMYCPQLYKIAKFLLKQDFWYKLYAVMASHSNHVAYLLLLSTLDRPKKLQHCPIEFSEYTTINKIYRMISIKSYRTDRSRFLQELAKHLRLLKEFEFASQSISVAATYSVCILQSPHISFYGRHKRGTVSFLWSGQLKNPQIRTQHSSLLPVPVVWC